MYNHLKALPFMLPLTQGQMTIANIDDWYQLNSTKWSAVWNKSKKNYYATHSIPDPSGRRRKDGNRNYITEYLHRYIMGLSPGDGLQVDHVNGKTLDNRKENLRIVSCRANHENRKNQSQYGPGVYRIGNRYQSQISIKGQKIHLGYFDTPQKAATARIRYKQKHNLK